MRTTIRFRVVMSVLVLVASLALIGFSRLPVGAEGSAADTIAMNVRGTALNESTDPAHVVYTVDIFSLSSGERIGTLHDVITCSTTAAPCLVFDVVTTFRFPQGEVVNHAQWSAASDPQRPGFLMVGTRPHHDTLESGTGELSGRTGHVDGSGTVDARMFPGRLGYDIFTVIRLNEAGGQGGQA